MSKEPNSNVTYSCFICGSCDTPIGAGVLPTPWSLGEGYFEHVCDKCIDESSTDGVDAKIHELRAFAVDTAAAFWQEVYLANGFNAEAADIALIQWTARFGRIRP